MNWSRQTLLGLGFFLGGSVMLFAMMQQMNTDEATTPVQTVTFKEGNLDDVLQASPLPLTADIETEQRILAQKQKERVERVSKQEKRTQEFLKKQEQAEALALKKARIESEKYRDNNVIEPVPKPESLDDLAAQVDRQEAEDRKNAAPEAVVAKPVITKPVVTARANPVKTTPVKANPVKTTAPIKSTANDTAKPRTDIKAASNTTTAVATAAQLPKTNTPPTRAFDYKVKRGEGLIKLAKRYNVPVEALALANDMSPSKALQVGQVIEIPSRKQVKRLLREQKEAQNAQAANGNSATKTADVKQQSAASTPAASKSAPTRTIKYSVARGDGLIKLARQYNVPVEALAQANNMSTKQNLQVGQTITIPSRKQVKRLQREAAQEERIRQKAKTAQTRLAQARSDAKNGKAKGMFGVQVALADNQARADEVAKKIRAAGYKVSTSPTSRGVRVIVGPEKGKQAALALKDKINADSKADVDNAWVLYWR